MQVPETRMSFRFFARRSLVAVAPGNRQRQRGFSVFELVVTLGIVGGLTTATSGLHGVVQSHQITAETNQLVAELNLARSESLKRHEEITLCPSVNGQRCDAASEFTWWHQGILLFVDSNGNSQVDGNETIVRIRNAADAIRIKSSRFRQHVVYQPNGMAGGNTITFTVCARGAADARYVIVSNTGRARVSSTPPDGRADEPLEICS